MKSQYAEELRPGQIVKEKFILTKKIPKEKKDGGYYTVVEFADRSGSIEGIAWDNVSRDLKVLTVGDFVFVVGNVSEYNERLQITVSSINKVPADEIDPADFLPHSDEDSAEVMAEIRTITARVQNPYLKKVLMLFFEDESFMSKFQLAPAAKKVHHAYLGGLAIHTRNILKLITNMQSVYKNINLDLLITAGFLHDIGKIDEFAYQRKIDISTKGKMLGHIIIGYGIVAEKVDKISDFPEDLKLKLLHMILSHHGEFEWGSPKLPVFPEALVLHFLDNLDSKLGIMIEVLKKGRGREKEWSAYQPYLEREIYLGEEL